MPESTGSWLITDTFRTTSSSDDPFGSGGGREVGVLRVFGDVDLTTHAAFEAGLARVLGDDPDRVVVDATAMGFCGARGLAAVMSTVARASERDIEVAVVGVSPLVRRLCGQLWPGPQPIWSSGLDDAMAGAGRRHAARPATDSAATSAVPA